MLIYPAIDLHQGRCVRLYQGDFQQVQVYGSNPLALALAYAARGAKFLHVVDLDGARDGNCQHMKLIARIKQESGLLIQSGGGVRNEKQVVNLIANGIARVVIGSLAVTDPDQVKVWLNTFGADRISLAIDVRFKNGVPLVAIAGWQEDSAQTLWDVLAQYRNTALKHILCTDISCDGTMQGPNLQLYREIKARYPDLSIQASGGIASLAHLRELAIIGLGGAVVGKALMEKMFTLERAIAEVGRC